MAFTAGTSNIQVVYPYSLIIGSTAFPCSNLSAGVSIIVDSGQTVKLLDGTTAETSEKLRLTAELIDLSSAQRTTLYNTLANTSQEIRLRLDSDLFYQYIGFTGFVIVSKAVKAGNVTKYYIEAEIEKGSSNESLIWSTYSP